jgi:hypothetical protein
VFAVNPQEILFLRVCFSLHTSNSGFFHNPEAPGLYSLIVAGPGAIF